MRNKTLTEPAKNNKVDHIDLPLGRRLKSLRILRGMSVQDLGVAINVSVKQITGFEKGTDRISCDRLFAFCRILNVPILFFFTSNEDDSGIINFSENSDAELITEGKISKYLLDLIRSFCKIKGSILRKKVLGLIITEFKR